MLKKHTIKLVVAFILLAGITFLGVYVYKVLNSTHIKGTPTVFVHGYKGTHHSFGNMLDRLENDKDLGEKVLTYRVSSSGQLKVKYTGYSDESPSYIQVVFEDNRANFKDTTKWLSFVLKRLKQDYGIDKVNLVGHSMGGIVALKYIEDYQSKKEYPFVHKFVSLGSPFDGIYNEEYFQINQDPAALDLKPESLALQILRKNKNSIPDNIEVFVIGSTGDEVAVPNSVLSIQEIISKKNLKNKIINNKKLGHSSLHENEDIDELVYEFLYEENKIESGNSTRNNLQ